MILHYKRFFENLKIDKIVSNFQTFNEQILSIPNRLDVLKQTYVKNKKPQLILADSNPHQMGDLTALLKQTRQAGIPLKILTGNLLELFNNNADLIYFPTWYITQKVERDCQSEHKKFRFSFLSSQARFHRLYFYQQCKSYVTDKDCFAVHLTNVDNQLGFIKSQMAKTLGHTIDLMADIPFISQSALDEYQEIFKQYPENSSGDHTNQHLAYSAMINITGESNTDADQVFITEKTWKAIRSRCLTMTLGNDGTVSALNKLGFELPGEVDPELPLLEKIEFIVDRIKLWDIEYCSIMYKKHIDSIEHNYDRFCSQALKNVFVDQIKEKLI